MVSKLCVSKLCADKLCVAMPAYQRVNLVKCCYPVAIKPDNRQTPFKIIFTQNIGISHCNGLSLTGPHYLDVCVR